MSSAAELEPHNIPKHVAIIMDGNGRWAQQRGMLRVMGHKVGVDSVREIVEAARELGLAVLTLYAFSTENWNRPAMEVQALMALLKKYLQSELSSLLKNDIRLRCVGEPEKLPADVQAVLEQVVRDTASNSSLTLNLALNYGGRHEIAMAARELARQCAAGELDYREIDEGLLSRHLYTAGQPDPDLLIRTGGESRLSNFLLWQASYAEIYVTGTLWPDFRKAELLTAIQDFQRRQRRFGMTSEQVQAG